MINRQFTAMICFSIGLAHSVAAQSAWDNPSDIPVVEPVTLGLAGEKPADIVRYLMARGAMQTGLSPDGTQLAFSYRVTGEPQLWIVDASGGWPTQLTFGKGITFFRWAPDGKHLLVARDADGNEREGYYLLSADGTQERQLLPLSDAFRSFGMFSQDGSQFLFSSTERNGRDFDIYVTDVADGKTRMAYEGDFGFYPRSWQPGGNLVIVDIIRGEDGNDVHLLDLASGKLTPLFQPDISAAYGNYSWLPDGSGFYLSSNQDREYSGLAFYSLADSQLEYIETPEADVERVSLSNDGKYLVWVLNEDGYSKIYARERNSGNRVILPEIPQGIYNLSFATTAQSASVHVTGPGTPGDVFVWDIESGKLAHTIVSTLAGLDVETFVTPVQRAMRHEMVLSCRGFFIFQHTHKLTVNHRLWSRFMAAQLPRRDHIFRRKCNTWLITALPYSTSTCVVLRDLARPMRAWITRKSDLIPCVT